MIVVLMGYMGSGKSTVGKNLATLLGYKFVDLDDFIVEQEGMAILDIFKTKNEIYFRKRESYYLNELLTTNNNVVLSLGGGTPCYGLNLELIQNNKNVKSFYLKCSITELAKRLQNEKEKRPLLDNLNNDEKLMEFIGKHLFERNQYYAEADFTIQANGEVKGIVEDIVLKLV